MKVPENAAAAGVGTDGERTIHGTGGTSQDTGSPVLDGALGAITRGFHVFPVDGKKPLVKWSAEATTDEATVRAWFTGDSHSLGYGIACGPSNLVVIDEDVLRALETFAARYRKSIPPTFTVVTKRGRHLYFTQPEGEPLRNSADHARGFDVRGAGGYVVGPGSPHKDGGHYVLVDDRPPVPLPLWLAEALRPPSHDDCPGKVPTERFTLPDVIPVGQRDEVTYRYACSMRAQGVPVRQALHLMEEAHGRCEQPSGDPFTLDDALAKVDAAWANYEGPTTFEIVTDGAGSTVDGDQASEQFVSGGAFILDVPDRIPAIWGEGDRVLWAQGESLILTGPQGVGKTTLVGQLVEAAIFGGTVLDLPVRKAGRVLYLAMDRPQQIRRSLARTMGNRSRVDLDDRLVVWPGPPPEDVAAQPKTLLNLARRADADVVVVDSIKDAAVGLADDKVGSGYNRARQSCLVNGVELVELHHMVKRGQNGDKPTTLADVYGSTWLTAGAGSVVLLWGDAGNRVVELRHLKQPAGVIGPFKVMHDHHAGRSTVIREIDLVAFTRAAGDDGVAAKQAAAAMTGTDTPQPADVEKARRRLDQLVRDGELHRIDGDRGARRAALWVADTRHESSHDTITLDLSGAASQHHHAASRGKE